MSEAAVRRPNASKTSGTIPLRAGRHLAVTWGLDRTFGGMTGAMLHRSRAFVRLSGVAVEVLTFDSRADYPEIEAALRDNGQLIDGIGVVNLYDWIREHPDVAADPAVRPKSGTTKNPANGFEPLVPADGSTDDGGAVALRDGVVYTRSRLSTDGQTTLQVDHYRADGTLAVSDTRDATERGTVGGRRITLCSADGTPALTFTGAWPLYHWWLDRLVGSDKATIIVDSKTSARFMLGYRRTNVLTLHIVHASHLEGPRSNRTVRASRRSVFEDPKAFDGLVFLTERQRQDARALLGNLPNLVVIPNSRDQGVQHKTAAERPLTRGVMLASLDQRKRIDHGIRAIVAARSAGHPVTLDVYGDGPDRESLEAEADSAQGAVTLHGFRTDAAAELPSSSFLLLTSRNEGLPLVLVESMAAGCLPIAYDIDYGPADVIDDGVNGFLVRAGDIEALADTIARLQSLPSDRVLAMRAAARRTAAAYSDEAITRLWAREIDRAAMRRGYLPSAPLHARVFRLRRGIARRLRRWRGGR